MLLDDAAKGNVEAVKAHIKRQGYGILNEVDSFGKSALLLSAMNGHRRVVKLCLKYGADIRHVDILGNSALCLASFHGHLSVVKCLLSHNQHLPTNFTNKIENSQHYLEKPDEKSSKNVSSKVNLLHANVNGETALMLATLAGRCDIAKVLLEKDSSKSHTALSNCQGLTYPELVELCAE